MALSSTVFLLLLSAIVVFGHLHPIESRRPGKGEGRKASTSNRDRKERLFGSQGNPENMLKVLDFSADNDHEPDSNGEYTSATLEAGPLPESFTICSAFMVEAWTTDFSEAVLIIMGSHGQTLNCMLHQVPLNTKCTLAWSSISN